MGWIADKMKWFGCRGFRAGALLGLAALLVFPGSASGDGKEGRKVVRVPCQAFSRVMVVDESGQPVSGYAYDYIQTIATYAGWDVEYVPTVSFSGCLEKIKSGEADLFYEVSYTEERAKEMLFPDEPMGFEYYYLYVSGDNTDITSDDYASLQGKKAGVTIGTMQIELLKEWCEKKGVDLEFVYYKDLPVKEADLDAGKIDLDYEVSMMARVDFSAVEKVGSSSYFLAVNKDRPDLVQDINVAMDKILNNDLYYFTRLQERYFSDMVHSRNLTAEEKEWVEGHDRLRVGYFDHYLPFSTRNENGEPVGSAIETVQEIVKRLELDDRLEVQFVCFDDQVKAYQAVERGDIDVMCPAYVSRSVKHDYRIIGGKGFATLASDLAFLEEYGEGKGKRIGVNRHNLMQYYYSKDSYPHSEIVFYDDIQGALEGLLEGTSDGTFLNGARTAVLLRPGKYHDIRAVRAKDAFELCMAFAEDNVGLLMLMNRGLSTLDPDFVSKSSYAYAGWTTPQSLSDFFQEHILSVVALAAVLAALVAALGAFRIRNHELKRINRTLEENYDTIELQREQLQTKQDELENALELAQSANRAKTTFLSNMSHDIRTPMNAIIGFTGLAANHIDDPEHVREYLKTIGESSEHLLSLINDILDMSRIESGKMTINEKVESLADILHALRDIVQADIQARQHHFFIDTFGIHHELVHCDRLRLNQVLFNLVSNAIKYTPPGGTISLRIVEKATAAAGRAHFEFRCKDNGIGMDGDFAKTVFDPFTRARNSTVSGIQGSGLGMAIAKNIVEMMGGTISVASKKGEGTEFTVSLDFRIADHQAPDPAIPELKGLRSLVVDDDVNACQSVADMLREAGMRSEWCASGKEAVIRTEESLRHGDRFKVYIVDWRMPDMDGLETVRRIRRVVGEDAAIIILTAYDWVDIEAEAREAGVTGFLSKPLFPSDLHNVLLQSCGRASPVRLRQKKESAPSLKDKKILLVDDSALNLKIAVLLLREQGAAVDTASNGKVAVDMVREKGSDHYDFVVMDVQMPVMDGYEATAAIRKLPGGDKLKIVAFSANAFEEDKEKSLRAGMNGHLSKPLKIKEFLYELQRFAS
jgi:signal transduction histidine kinase/DNA-binding response OmpR family regulator